MFGNTSEALCCNQKPQMVFPSNILIDSIKRHCRNGKVLVLPQVWGNAVLLFKWLQHLYSYRKYSTNNHIGRTQQETEVCKIFCSLLQIASKDIAMQEVKKKIVNTPSYGIF